MYEPQFAPTHVVPRGGLPAWPEPRRGNRPGRPSARQLGSVPASIPNWSCRRFAWLVVTPVLVRRPSVSPCRFPASQRLARSPRSWVAVSSDRNDSPIAKSPLPSFLPCRTPATGAASSANATASPQPSPCCWAISSPSVNSSCR